MGEPFSGSLQIIEYSELEGIHQDNWIPAPMFHFRQSSGSTRKKTPTLCLWIFNYKKKNEVYNSGYATLHLLLVIGLYCIIFCFVIIYLILHYAHQLRSAKLPSRDSWVLTVKLWTTVTEKPCMIQAKKPSPRKGFAVVHQVA